jgi:D-lyxose ketol-isomerase
MAVAKEQWQEIQKRTLSYFEKAYIALTEKEKAQLEIADFGLAQIEEIGLEVITYLNTERCCSKELILFPGQTCPEHKHPPVAGGPGKEETFRCRWGETYIYVEGAPVAKPQAKIPQGREKYFTVFHEIVLHPGEQYTLIPNTLHWFQAGPDGAIVSEFSTKSRDEADIFTDPNIKRAPEVI